MTAHRGITECNRADQALRECQEMLHDYLDNTNDIIQSVAPEGRFLYVNRKWRNTFGYAEQDLVRLSIADIVHPDHRVHHEAAWQQLLAGKTIDNFESVFLTKDGRSITVAGNIRPQLEGGQTLAMRAILCDVTERTGGAGALQEAREEASRSVRELEVRTRKLTRLSEMGNLLQSCQASDEAYNVISRLMPLIFPEVSGALCIFTAPGEVVEAMATWGDIRAEDCAFGPEDCWALRRGRLHSVETPDSVLRCRHLGQATPTQYLCAPLIAQGEVLGVLHLRSKQSGPVEPDGSTETWVPDAMRCVVLILADQISISLASVRACSSRRFTIPLRACSRRATCRSRWKESCGAQHGITVRWE